MKKILILFLFVSFYSFATPPLLLRPNTSTIILQGTPSDTAITLQRLVLVEDIEYRGYDSTVTITFNAYVNLKEYRNGNAVSTNVPLNVPRFKASSGSSTTITNMLQQARTYYLGLGYLVGIQ